MVPFWLLGYGNACILTNRPHSGRLGCLLNVLEIAPSMLRVFRRLGLLDVHRVKNRLRLVRFLRRRFAEIPETKIVVAVCGFNNIGLGVELDAHLTDIVSEQTSNRAADSRI